MAASWDRGSHRPPAMPCLQLRPRTVRSACRAPPSQPCRPVFQLGHLPRVMVSCRWSRMQQVSWRSSSSPAWVVFGRIH
eukprot:60977-Lingulodinium_polyedra.AAC.1